MPNMPQTIVLSVGGSIIVPKEINLKFLIKFRRIILDYVKKGNRVIIVAGGGNIARVYQGAAKKLAPITDYELDLIGIKATRINAELVRSIFYKESYENVVEDPTKKINTTKKIIVGSGWKPGFSSDKDAVYLAQNFRASTVINMTNVEYVYDKDPKKFKDARPIRKMSWEEMEKIVGKKWIPGSNLPFDPIASQLAARLGLKVIILNDDLDNFKNLLENKNFKGTVIY